MIRVLLDTSQTVNGQVTSSIEQEADALNIQSISFHRSVSSSSFMAIVEGDDADRLSAFMLPPNSLNTHIATLDSSLILSIVQELQLRKINTSGSVTCGDLLNNICKFFNADFKSLGSIVEKDFS